MRGHFDIRRALAFATLVVLFVLGAATAVSAQTVPGGYTGGGSVQGAVDDNPDPPPAVPAPTPTPAGRLAFTGADVMVPMMIGGGTLLLVGSIAVLATRARRSPSGAT